MNFLERLFKVLSKIWWFDNAGYIYSGSMHIATKHTNVFVELIIHDSFGYSKLATTVWKTIPVIKLRITRCLSMVYSYYWDGTTAHLSSRCKQYRTASGLFTSIMGYKRYGKEDFLQSLLSSVRGNTYRLKISIIMNTKVNEWNSENHKWWKKSISSASQS